MKKQVQITSYLHPRYYRLFIADCFISISGKSKKAVDIVTEQLNKLDGKK